MTEGALFNSVIRFFVLLVLQVFLLQQITWGFGEKDYLFVFIYPLFILLLPLRMLRPLVILSAFTFGLCIDLFYETLGLHAAACTFSAFMRGPILSFVRPKEGYNIKAHPTGQNLGWSWFSTYTAIFLGVHLVSFFAFQAFTFVYWKDVLFKSLFSFPVSYFAIMFAAFVFNPKY